MKYVFPVQRIHRSFNSIAFTNFPADSRICPVCSAVITLDFWYNSSASRSGFVVGRMTEEDAEGAGHERMKDEI